MLENIISILLMGFLVGQIARRLKATALVGIVLVGIVLVLKQEDYIFWNCEILPQG
ncbi:hypothetical protein [Argonema antarcticum]|uniref:hypothetical protein n=1 Tax=Argonema antarcticum TaxID=2942763 RepID=UPI00201302BB|nr:hypothetical protein [Argonema antarcticum]MCL1471713.1 hypothetical protein [Argonema antarcticum A004/B2]